MIRKIAVLLLCQILAVQVYSQLKISNNVRPAFKLKLFVNDSVFYNAPMEQSFYIVRDSIIQIFPGEKLYIEADVANNRLINFKVVPEISDKSKTLIIEFHQEAKGRVHEQMMLTIHNPFNKSLNYKALMNLMKYKKWVETSVIPVRPKLKSIETWPDIITTMALTGFRLE